MSFFTLTPVEIDALRLSLWVSFWAVAVSLPLGILTAWGLARLNFPGKSLLDSLVHLPLVLPPVAIGYMLLILFGRRGVIGAWLYHTFGLTFAFNWKGAALASAVMAFPLLVRAVRLSLESVDQGLEAAARTLGAGPVRVFFTVTLPLVVPGLMAGMILAFARSLGEFGATITLCSNIQGQTQTLPLAMFQLIQTPGGERGAMRLCIISVVIAVLALMVSEFQSKRFAARKDG